MQLPHQVLMWQSSNQQPVSGAGGSCHLGPQGRHSPRPLALDSKEYSLHVTALSSLPTLWGVGSNLPTRFAGEEMGWERTCSFSKLQDVLNNPNRWQITP